MRQLLILFVLALLFGGGYLGLKHWKERKERKESEAKKLFPAASFQEVKTIEIYRENESPHRVVLRKEGNRWWIVDPIRYRAVDATPDSLISQVRDKTYERSFTPTKPLSVYGLDPPRYLVTFYTETTPYTLAVGTTLAGPSSGKVYLGRGTTRPTEILITFTGFQYHLSKNLDDYRSRDVVWEFPSNVTYMEFVSKEASYALTRTNEGWYLGSKSLDFSKVEAILSRLRTLTVRDFYGDWPTATPPSGERSPQRQITIKGDTLLTFWFFSPNTKEGYVPLRVSERAILMSISDYAYRDLWKSPKDLEKEEPKPVTAPTPLTPESHRPLTVPPLKLGAERGVTTPTPALPMSVLPATPPAPPKQQ